MDRSLALSLALVCVAACRSGAPAEAPASGWSEVPPGVPATWRELSLYNGPCAFVLASSPAAAAQAHEIARVAHAAFLEELGRSPASALLIAVSSDDPLLVEDAEELIDLLPRWNAAATGREAPPGGRASSLRRRRNQGEVSPALSARLVTAGIPEDEPRLDLPAALREHVAHVVLLPTAACLEATCTTIVDEAFEREGVSWLQRSLVTAMAGDPAKLMARELSNYSLATVLDVWLTTDRVPAAQAEAVLARAGVAGVLRERSDLSIDDLNSEPGSETGPIPESPPAKGARDAGG